MTPVQEQWGAPRTVALTGVRARGCHGPRHPTAAGYRCPRVASRALVRMVLLTHGERYGQAATTSARSGGQNWCKDGTLSRCIPSVFRSAGSVALVFRLPCKSSVNVLRRRCPGGSKELPSTSEARWVRNEQPAGFTGGTLLNTALILSLTVVVALVLYLSRSPRHR